MVLPAPAAPAPSAPGVSGWIEEIRQGLQLSPAGVLILVDHAVPEKLGALVRALLADHPGLDVLTEVAELSQASDGAVVVFLPKASDAGWLNLNRPMFARKALKVVLFCEREVTEALSRQAPDFYDWISHRQECPAGAVEHAIWGIRRALLARAPGILFVVDRNQRDRFEHVERVFREALPGRHLLWLKPLEVPFQDLVAQIREAGRRWVACDAPGYNEAERFRWALAEAGRRTRALLLLPEVFEDWFWSISDALFGKVGDVIELLRKAGAQHPGRMAAVAGLEAPVIVRLSELLAMGYREEALLRTMLRAPDPGAALAETILAAGIEERPLQGYHMSAPVQRHLGNRTGLRRPFRGPTTRTIGRWVFQSGSVGLPLLRGRADRIEYILRRESRTPERWLEIARLALDHGDADTAASWAERALMMQSPHESLDAYLLHGLALAELCHINWRMSHSSLISLRQRAERALRRAEEMLSPGTPPEDALAIYALRARILMDLGEAGEEERPLRRALRLINKPSVRARAWDLKHVARTLQRKGRHDRATEVLKAALKKVEDPMDRARLQLDLGWSAYRAGRLDEAISIAESLYRDEDSTFSDTVWEVRASADTLRILVLLSRGDPKRALALADTELTRTAAQWPKINNRVFYRIPLLARSLGLAGRFRDAEVILRKILDLPIEFDTNAFALGLSSREVLLSFLSSPLENVFIPPPQRRGLWNHLVHALRAQGRHLEADAMERRRDEDSAASTP